MATEDTVPFPHAKKGDWRLVAQGKTNRASAQALQISTGTVKTYLRRLYAKLGVASRAEAARRVGEMSTKG